MGLVDARVLEKFHTLKILIRYYEKEDLNKAYFHIRVDENKVFHKIIDDLREQLRKDSYIEIQEEKLIDKIDISPKLEKIRKVPFLSWETEHIKDKLQNIVKNIPDYHNFPEKTENKGTRQWTEYKLADKTIIQPEIRQEDFSYTNKVRVRVVLQRAIINKISKAWDVIDTSTEKKFDVLVGWGSDADHELREYADQLVKTYLNEMLLKVRINEPYQVGNIKVERDEKKCRFFKNALHTKYSNLNGLENKIASALDSLGIDWCRNPHFSGYGIELIDEGRTKIFYPDFLLWPNNDTVVCLEVTGKHLEHEKLKRKLVRISESSLDMVDEAPRNVYVIILVQYGNPKEKEEVYYKVWYRRKKDGAIDHVKIENIPQGIDVILSDCL